jgi:hypothetical protein
MLTPRIFCFTEDGSFEELTYQKFLGVFYFKEFFLGVSLSRPSYLRGGMSHDSNLHHTLYKSESLFRLTNSPAAPVFHQEAS